MSGGNISGARGIPQADQGKIASNPPAVTRILPRTIQRQALVDVALGRIPADVVIKGGTLVDVCARRLVSDCDVAVHGKRIALTGDASHTIGHETRVIDAKGMYLVPGFVDAHYHIESSRLSPRRHAQLTLPMGTTALFEGSHEICNALGLEGIAYMLEEGRDLPQKIYVVLPSATPPTPYETSGGFIGGDEAAKALTWDRVVGIGEVMDYARLFNRGERLWQVIQAGLEAGKVVEGHGAPSSPRADAWLDAGISSTHFAGAGDIALGLLQRGVFLELKVRGSRDAIKKLLEMEIDWQMVGMCVDDRSVHLLSELGHMNHEVRLAIETGLHPLIAYQLATINNARHWRLEHEIGVIAPGRCADILFISNLEGVEIDRVMADGQIVAANGRLVVDIPILPAPSYVRNSIRLPKSITANNFEMRVSSERVEVEAVVLRPFYFSADLGPITETLSVEDGVVQRDLEREISKAAIVDRHGRSIGVSFWKVGYKEGAIAMSILHDSHDISVIGATDGEMAFAVNRVIEIGGGIAVVRDDKALAEISLPIGGLMSDRPHDEVIEDLRRIDEEAATLCPGSLLGEDPVNTQTFMFLTCYPRRIVLTDQGLMDVETGEKIPAVT